MKHARRWAAVAALALIAAGAFEPLYIRIYRLDTPAFRTMMATRQYRMAPGLQRFYGDVRAWTKPGERIAIWPTFSKWDEGYEYIVARAFYILSSREVLEVVRTPQNFSRADVIAAWHAAPDVPGFAIVQRSEDGTLLRRVR